MTASAAGKPTYLGIQYLRGLAAMLVVFHHARNPSDWLYNPLVNLNFGARGVDIFFVISGFIMYTAARDEAVSEFIRRRLIRIAPLYWLATLLWLAMSTLVWRQPLTQGALADVGLSLSFIPHIAASRPDGYFPLLGPGWTLIYELTFYAAFAIGLALSALSLQRQPSSFCFS